MNSVLENTIANTVDNQIGPQAEELRRIPQLKMHSQDTLAPGTRAVIRDQEWLIRRIDPSADGGWLRTVTTEPQPWILVLAAVCNPDKT